MLEKSAEGIIKKSQRFKNELKEQSQ